MLPYLDRAASRTEIEQLREALHIYGPDPYSGVIPWNVIDTDECERLGFFSGIRVGNQSIYVRWEDGTPQFEAFEGERRVRLMNQHQFWSLMRSLLGEEQIYWVSKHIWRTGS
jgi:hypothetical protein